LLQGLQITAPLTLALLKHYSGQDPEQHLRSFSRKVLNENELNYNILESSRDDLQEYAIKSREFHLRN